MIPTLGDYLICLKKLGDFTVGEKYQIKFIRDTDKDYCLIDDCGLRHYVGWKNTFESYDNWFISEYEQRIEGLKDLIS